MIYIKDCSFISEISGSAVVICHHDDVIVFAVEKQIKWRLLTKTYDKHAITFLRKNKNYGVKRLLKEFPNKSCTRGGLSTILAKIGRTGSSQRKPGTGDCRVAASCNTRFI